MSRRDPDLTTAAEREWLARNNCDHGHCPDGCEHPQAAPGDDGEMYCMRCWCVFGERVRMVPCTPETCAD